MGTAVLTHEVMGYWGLLAASLAPGAECCSSGAALAWPQPSLSLTPTPAPAAIFCDYYNPPDECEWHYEPCGNRSFETCRTVNGIHSNISVSYLEGKRASAWRDAVPMRLGI